MQSCGGVGGGGTWWWKLLHHQISREKERERERQDDDDSGFEVWKSVGWLLVASELESGRAEVSNEWPP